MEYELIPTDEIPIGERRGRWLKIINKFIDSGEKISYIQVDNLEELKKVSGGLYNAALWTDVIVSQRSHLLRIYFEKKSVT